ncbi:unnamed protein product [Musa acuminata subsp. malaccensis]|uniref:(wild Malaysian banana) hypothetical protein n=1 Tax=Musa acuminata subsp. malaccensis TaxID=214687 RepID=A0A804HMW0_MUSAM|nr:PREDICTED: uncharacterized protein LOC103974052 [Musa acuminata subsp. malaccensis]CAG1842377.1 unnamed protein product [Musa acuminata subsp. malaccensis]
MMADLRRRPPTTGLEKAIWVSKIGFFLLGILSTGVATRLAVPPAAGVLASALPRFWASLCSWLVPPYLFVVIHLIILVIWKLSDQKQQLREEKPPVRVGDVKAKTFVPPSAAPPPGEPLAESWHEVLPSPKTAPELVVSSGAGEPSDPPTEEKPAASSSFGINTSTEPSRETSDVSDELETAAAAASENAVDIDSMDATWKAIMKKSPSRGWEKPGGREPRPSEKVAIRWREPSATGRDELNRRFDDFIRKNYDQIRLQRHESNQRRLEMSTAGLH